MRNDYVVLVGGAGLERDLREGSERMLLPGSRGGGRDGKDLHGAPPGFGCRRSRLT